MKDRSIGPELLEEWALSYMSRYASSAENLRRVLMRRVRRRFVDSTAELVPLIDALVARYRQSGLLDDAAYAAARVHSLHRRGDSLRAIRARLVAKGVAASEITAAVAELRSDGVDPDLAAACAFARRRRLGPYRRGGADHARELAAFARAGFSRHTAERVLTCPDIAAVEALARDEFG